MVRLSPSCLRSRLRRVQRVRMSQCVHPYAVNYVRAWVSAHHAQMDSESSKYGTVAPDWLLSEQAVYGSRDPCLRQDSGTGGLRREQAPVPCAPAMADHIRTSQCDLTTCDLATHEKTR